VILDIDAGNSFVKWRVVDDSEVIAAGSEATEQVSKQGLDLTRIESLNQARISSVANRALAEKLREQVQQQFNVEMQIARVSSTVSGVSCGYTEPETLGIDRWLAVVAAYQRYLGPVLVVDAGSAITIDLIGPQGVHLGGYISPGLRLMREALWQGTAKVQVDRVESLNMLVPGTCTQDAVNRGCLLAVVATIEKLASQYPASIVITGGDATVVAEALSLTSDHVPDLVLDGLAVNGVEFTQMLIS
jgi:type III pantothenate kinase